MTALRPHLPPESADETLLTIGDELDVFARQIADSTRDAALARKELDKSNRTVAQMYENSSGLAGIQPVINELVGSGFGVLPFI